MVDSSKDKDDKGSKKEGSKKNDKKAPSILIVFKVKTGTPWAVYPRLFNNEETALAKLEQSYPFEEYKAIDCDLV